MEYQGYNTAAAKCQRKHHSIVTVGDLLALIKHINSMLNPNYKPRKNCKYNKCKEARNKGCRNPHRCGISTRKLLNKLQGEWGLLKLEGMDEGEINNRIKDQIDSQISTPFDKTTKVKSFLEDSIHVFATNSSTTHNNREANKEVEMAT